MNKELMKSINELLKKDAIANQTMRYCKMNNMTDVDTLAHLFLQSAKAKKELEVALLKEVNEKPPAVIVCNDVDIQQHIEKLRKENEQLKKQSDRLNWLMQSIDDADYFYFSVLSGDPKDKILSFIDSAMKGKKA